MRQPTWRCSHGRSALRLVRGGLPVSASSYAVADVSPRHPAENCRRDERRWAMGLQDLVDNLEVVIAHLRNADTAPEVYTEVLATLWQANVVVEQVGASWVNTELESAYSKFAALEHPDE